MKYFIHSLFFHLVLVTWLFFYVGEPPKKQQKKTVTVTTVKLAPTTLEITPALEILPPPPEPEVVKPKVAPPPPPPPPPQKKETPKKPEEKPKKKEEKKVVKPPTPAPPPKVEVKIDPKKENLLNEARAALASLNKKETTKEASVTTKGLQIDFSMKGFENDLYATELIKRLKLGLRLPESGEVIVDLTLQRSGKIAKMAIRESKSKMNRLYVETTLPSLHFPSFGDYYPKDDEKLFTLTLHNALF